MRLERAEFERERAFGGRTSSAIGPDLELVRAQLHEQEAKLEERARFVTEQARELAQRSRELEDLREQLTVRDIELQEREELRLALKEATRASEVLQTQLDELRNELGAAEVRQLQSSEEHTAVVQTARREEEARQLEVATLKAELQQAYDKLRAGGRNGEGNDSPPLDHERATLTKQLQELDQRRAELHAMRDSIEQEAVARSKQTQAELKHLRDERAALDGDRQLREQGWVQLHAERASVNRERTAVAEQLSLLEVQRRQLLDGMAPDETKVADAEVERLRQQVEAGRQVALERDRALNALKSAEERAREQDAEAVRLRGELDAARQAKGPSAEAPSPPHRVADSPVVSATTRDRFRPLVAAAFGLVLGAVLVWFTRGSDSPPSPVAGAPAATVQAVVAQTAEVSPLPASLPSTWVAETAPTPLVEKPKKKKPQTSDELFEDAFK